MAAPMVLAMAAFFNWKLLFVISTAFLLSMSVNEGARLSDPKVLMPFYSSVVTNFTLKINLTRDEARTPSCYTWRSSRLDVATVQLINSTDNECALSAEISAVSKSSMRKTSIVLVENKVTGEVLKCIVIVDELSRIEIETTTRLLYLEDSPEEMIVRGYDSDGNVFSSLQGLEFEWSLHSDTSGSHDDIVDANSILRILKFSDSHYTTPIHIEKLEDRDRQGDVILVEGMKTGSAFVWAKLTDPVHSSVAHSSVRLMVIANLIVSPPEAYILKFATVKYKVEQIRQNSVVAITMPSAQFYLEAVESGICNLDPTTSVATALELGETEVKLIDKNIKVSDQLVQPSAILHVVSASYLGFTVLPDRKWVLETGRVYTILIDAYDLHSHKLHPSDNVMIESMFPEKYFEVLFSTKNGTYHVVRTLKKGETDLEGSLDTVIKQDGSEFKITPALSQTQFVEIFDPIVVRPELLFFPWDPVKQLSHKYQLAASGGSGDYIWSSNDPTVATVNKYGEVTTSNLGETEVTAADRRNTLHKGTAKIHILPPSGMEFRPERVEVVVGSYLPLPLDVQTILGGRVYSFHDCRNMPLNVTFSDPSVVELVKGFSSLAEGSCTTVKVKALQQGHTKVKVTYSHGKVILDSSITIATYEPLEPIDPEKEAVVTLGSSKEVVFSGGPQPWVLDSSKYFQIPHNGGKKVSSGESKNVLIHPVKTIGSLKRVHTFFVTCKNYGEQTLTLRVGNEKTAKNQNPAVVETSVSFVCAEPVEIHLQPDIELPRDLPPCPASREPNAQIPVYCKKSLDILVSVTDKNGRKFDNISSLEFDWSLSDTSLASLPYDLESEVTVTLTGRKIVSNTMLLRPNGVPGLETITVSVSSYKQEYLNAAKSTQSAKITPTITKTLDLRLVEEAVVSPETLAVFNHPSNKVAVDIDRGSGYFYVVEGRTEVIDLKYQEKAKKIQIIPIKDGQLTVTIYDLCIATSQPAQITVTVSGVGSVQLYVMDKVEVGQDVKARVEVLDVSGERLYASFFPLMGLNLLAASDIVTLKRDQASAPDKYSALYTVHGSVVGHTTLKAIVQLPDRSNVTSAVRPVEVFPPLELIPRNITLIIGALFQVLSRGGPRPQCTVEYSIRNSDIALVSSSGLLKAQELGATRVVGQAVGQDPETGGTVVYSQDEAIVNVVRLVGVKIHAPLTRLQSGTTMPMFAVGLTEHETPFMFGASVPPFSFKWTVNKKDVAHLQSVYHKSNISPGQEGNFGSQLVAIETGHVSVRLQVTPVKGQGQVVGDDVLTDELQVQVFEELVMLQPRVCDGDLLMTPNTEAVLKTNRDGGAQMSYEVVGQGREVATVVDGVLISGPTQGQAALHVTAMEESGVVQTLVVMVKVKPVSYLMINSDTQLRTSGQTLSTVPRGATLLFTVTYHDDVGASFYSTNIDMRFRCSRYDLAQVNHGLDNNTIVMKTASVGQTILKVWDNYKPWLMDYINVPVGNAIEPALPSLSVGSVVCFTAPLTTDNGLPGTWKGSKGLVVDIKSGISNAQHPGPASLTYTVSDDVLTSTEVQLEPVGIVTMESGSEFVSTVTKNGDTVFTVYVNLGDTPTVQGSGCLSLISEQNYKPPSMPFTCDLGLNYGGQNLDIGDLFTIKPVFISKQGRYACQIKPVSSTSTSKISTAEISVVVTATVTEFKGQREVKAKPLSLPFLPPFHIHNTEIHVSTLTPLSSVRVSTNVKMASQIQVVVSDPSILEALPPESDAQSNDIIIYPIKLLNSVALWEREQLDVWVNLIGRKTGQKVKIPVFIRLIGQKPDISSLGDVGWRKLFSSILHNYQYWFILLIIIFVTALTVLFGYHAVYGPRYNAAANTSFVQSPKGSPVPQNYSPSSPPAYSSYYASPTPKTPMLWSTYQPLDGNSPARRRSPVPRYSPS
ncbi:nuclear pore membrane glycoprotein 210-like [Mya arenaria]|uniref:nuclear pore membrane glycoprotein 210-like n=1 Tax=Mya arenaria TaxID=6604 RepID=UPI0022E3BC34|nr:nuclear pore membrane glycoprotein 210-like [Mya arenaria]